ncbi:hypothetical protein E6R18_29065 [Streptomyces sp. A1277]|uniref:hypothetical protein n=1 Tax=Streptomyces sp. A1277 TaxID=2563103 RepID=UPI0010A23195|nr:hypothetical protein [Streptomyces sp. A1277]THA28115.1 hypothetical protein E6R18_29065 [Streptomyces sp. A1277]
MRRQHVKLTVVLVAVVLALTGFSSSSHGGKSGKSRRSSSHSSGGGCSNSKKSNGTYHDTDSGTRYRTSGGTSGTTRTSPTPTATAAPKAYVFRCAQPAQGTSKAVTASTVRLTANASGTHTYEVDVAFLDAAGTTIDTGEATVQAARGETKTVSVQMDRPSEVARVSRCTVTATLGY